MGKEEKEISKWHLDIFELGVHPIPQENLIKSLFIVLSDTNKVWKLIYTFQFILKKCYSAQKANVSLT